MTPSSTLRYDPLSRWLHWGMACLLPVQILLGYMAERVTSSTLERALFDAHFQIGMVLLALVVVRLAWCLLRPRPAALAMQRWARNISRAVHGALYVLLLLLPLSGYVIWIWMGADRHVLGLFDVPQLFSPPSDDERGRAIAWYVHVIGAWSLTAFIVLHVAAACWHQWVRKDDLVRRRMF